jgi:hypothetical protein
MIYDVSRSRIHEFRLRLRFLRHEVSVYNAYINVYMHTLQTSFKPLLLKGVGSKNH